MQIAKQILCSPFSWYWRDFGMPIIALSFGRTKPTNSFMLFARKEMDLVEYTKAVLNDIFQLGF
jgi:hypothetical protein